MKIRAKVAFMEVVALLAPDEMIPILVEITPMYLGSALTQKWIRAQQFNSRSNLDSKKRKGAAENLSRLAKAIEGDKRSKKKRRYSYWRIGTVYEDLTSKIKGFREQRKESTFDPEFYSLFCKHHDIPEPYPELILDSKKAARQLALDIMVAKDLIPDAKAFRDFQPFINKIQKKHFNGGVLGIANEFMPIVFDFMDLPTQHPELVLGLDPLQLLEKVPINFVRPNS